jgi:hypothetical protein
VLELKKVIRENIICPYGLHDMNTTRFEVCNKDILMRLQSGMYKISDPVKQVDGYVKFCDVDFDFCFVTIINELVNEGPITGEKMSFLNFIDRYQNFSFEIIDEVYGYNKTKFWGWLSVGGDLKECIIEFYHFGDMIFVDETSE